MMGSRLEDMDIPLQIQLFIVFGIFVLGTIAGAVVLSTHEKKLKALFGGAGETEDDIRRNVVRRTAWLEAKNEELERRIEPLEAISRLSVQKVGFLRFNPFQDTGGDNSFALALLDRENNGVILSSFYTREGVRIYAKQIENGASRQALSDEEKKVLEEALNRSTKFEARNSK